MFNSNDEAAGYLAGATDADGCVYYGEGIYAQTGRKRIQRRIIFEVTDVELVDAFAEACDLFDIQYSRSNRPGQTPNRKHRYKLEITSGHALRLFHQAVPLKNKAKSDKLQKCLDSYEMKGLCAGCQKPYSEETSGCENCRNRHRYRRTIRPNGLMRRVG